MAGGHAELLRFLHQFLDAARLRRGGILRCVGGDGRIRRAWCDVLYAPFLTRGSEFSRFLARRNDEDE